MNNSAYNRFGGGKGTAAIINYSHCNSIMTHNAHTHLSAQTAYTQTHIKKGLCQVYPTICLDLRPWLSSYKEDDLHILDLQRILPKYLNKKAFSHAVGNYSERFKVVLQVGLGDESILLFVICLYNHTVT